MNEQSRQLVLTFLLVNHADQVHTYQIPSFSPDDPLSVAKALEIVQAVLADVQALLNGTSPVKVIHNPANAYRASHVIGVKIEGTGPEEFQQMIAQEQRQIGFIKS